ncbi:cob(I)yrinic acid a,c-diamide adenosyltransferase [Papillibacter cinnamivorans]|uniref:Cob(I)alamin adenosyltransferase n=1 Tax=Papillibacter cinnamivorans DSM 12816 TaxID=1122930 RepID=A0A1W2AAT5_9FIRM|nr:cob(I)yrinic acid a,c-diamide adenosyltransferase [Papillibacter cinnamivorans]SMC57776.1 cob(I)alamin adenosyltransferase [Papillibacter cinnamivorans DSM 12816]
MEKGLVHVYFGDGKGKTTAALGLGLRASGRGYRVLMVRFLKGRDSGEIRAAEKLPNFRILPGPERIPFFYRMNDEEQRSYRTLARAMFSEACDAVESGEADLLILDEILDAISSRILETEEVAEFLKHKPRELEVVLTGRNPPREISDLADYITEMRKIRHPYDSGITARPGIEK